MHTDTIGYKIRLLHNQIHKRMEAKRQENEKEPLTGMQRWTLGFLRDHDGKDIYQKDIETEFSVSRATASNMLAVMERKGLVRREAVEHEAGADRESTRFSGQIRAGYAGYGSTFSERTE